jgi:hypothetical protein
MIETLVGGVACLAIPAGLVAGVLVYGSNSRAGVYVYRTRKPGAPFGLPIIGRHFAYVGQSKRLDIRHRQHSGKPLPWDRYASTGQPWSDLNPVCYRLRLPPWRWLLLLVEALLIGLLWPVYNIKLNKHNPRRITAYRAIQMRATRDALARHAGPTQLLARTIAALRWYHFAGMATLVAVGWGLIA